MSRLSSLLRRLLLAVLLAAVPLQGYAAAAMLYCHARGTADLAQAGQAGHEAHAAGVAGAHHGQAHAHGQGHDASQSDPAPGVEAVMPESGWLSQAATGCSVCSAMCLAGVLVATSRATPLPPGGHATFPPFDARYAGVVLDLPDPPPLAIPL